MAYSKNLADRIRKEVRRKRGIQEIHMFGGLCFMVHGNMALGIDHDSLIVRVGPERYESSLKRSHTRPFDLTGRPLRGFVYVGKDGLSRLRGLKFWINEGIEFAKSLPKKGKKK